MSKHKILIFLGSRAEAGILREIIYFLNTKYEVYYLINSQKKKNNFFFKEFKEIKKNICFINLKLKNTKQEDIFKFINEFVTKSEFYLKKNFYKFGLVLGDRYEALMFAYLCTLKRIPLVHFQGGEATYGAIDELHRHAITKMSSLHFVTCDKYKKRVISLGERPSTVVNIGSMSGPAIKNYKFLNLKSLSSKFSFLKKKRPYMMVTFHPETYSKIKVSKQIEPMLSSLKNFNKYNFIFTSSNLDENGIKIKKIKKNFVRKRENCYYFDNLGHKDYLNLMKYSSCVIGNSSSGILESSLIGAKCLNIGDRQKGRMTSNQTISVKNKVSSITAGLNKILNLKNEKIQNIYYKKYGLNLFKNTIMRTNFDKLLPKIFYEKK